MATRVVTETDPVKALGLFHNAPESFDLIISDMTMPAMTGDKLAEALLKIRRNIPIIICTGFSEKIDKEKALSMGIREYVEKPVNQTDMARIVRNVLDEANV